jgi:hypothetical protein
MFQYLPNSNMILLETEPRSILVRGISLTGECRTVTRQTFHFPQRWDTGWTIEVLGFDSRRGLGIFLFTTASRKALAPPQPPIQWVPGAVSIGVKRLRREADHSPPSSAEVKEQVELYLHSPNTPSWFGA